MNEKTVIKEMKSLMILNEWIFSGDLFGKLSKPSKKFILNQYKTLSLFCEIYPEFFKLNNNKKKNNLIKLKRLKSLKSLIQKIPDYWIECGTLFSTFSIEEKNEIYQNYGKFLKFIKTFPNEIQLFSNEFSHYIKKKNENSIENHSLIEEIERKMKKKFENNFEDKLIKCEKKKILSENDDRKLQRLFVKENFEFLFFNKSNLMSIL